ncbi:uncharacterized protein LOC125377334 [Haliotis rufescens]|uniref:uncharacterized protein LOC125377334 n=1 Tax=Haliotis rufescens TaxID=6454 RepID=UPI00201F94B2|nr:uncharacterized protein LOC125377334 [Haliotis rufescens]
MSCSILSAPRMTVVGSCVVLVLCSVVLQVSGTKNGWAPQWMHDRFCDGRHEYVSLPWDCSGYIHCGDKSSHWLNCAPTLKFNNQSQTCDLKSPSCENPETVATKWCQVYSTLKFAHPHSCSLYYDCSKNTPSPEYGLKVYEKECKWPTLFDPIEMVCQEDTFNTIVCDKRPVSRCDYVTECTTPESFNDACVSLPDGPHAEHSAPFSTTFVRCVGQRVQEKVTCDTGEVFDTGISNCTGNFENSVNEYCRNNPTAVFADPFDCALFYNCSASRHRFGLEEYQAECRYMHLFDMKTNTCVDFADLKASCGTRREPKAPCDYRVNDCTADGCTPCSASCVGLPDGDVPYPNMHFTRFYLNCRGGRTVKIKRCTIPRIFSIAQRTCANPEDVDRSATLPLPAAVTTTVSTASPTTSTVSIPSPTTAHSTTDSSSTTPAAPTTTVTTTPSSTTTPTSTAPTTPFTVNPNCGCKPELSPIVRTLNEVLPKVNALSARMDNEVRPPFSCDTPPTLADSHVKLSYAPDNAVATYTCDEGHAPCFAGMTSTCSSDNMWTLQSLGQCVQNTWTNQPAQVGARTLCPPRPGSVWAFTGRYTRDK